jgi:hypothetical protein
MATITGTRAKWERKAQAWNSKQFKKHSDFSDDGGKCKGLIAPRVEPPEDRTLFGDLSEMYEYKRPWQRRVR